MGETVTLTAAGVSRVAGVENTDSSRITEWTWGSADPKRTVAAGSTGGVPVGASEYENVSSSFTLERKKSPGDDGGDSVDWLSDWEAVCFSASQVTDASLQSQLADGRKVKWRVERASVKPTNRGDVLWHRGIAQAELTVVHSPVGEGDQVTLVGATSQVGPWTTWTASTTVPGDVPALLDVEVDNTGKWVTPPAAHLLSVGGAVAPSVTWTLPSAAPSPSTGPPGASAGVTTRSAQIMPGNVTPVIRATATTAGRWWVSARMASFMHVEAAPVLTESDDPVVEVAFSVDGRVVSAWHPLISGHTTNAWAAPIGVFNAPVGAYEAEFWRLVEFGEFAVSAGATVELVARVVTDNYFARSRPFNVYVEAPMIVDRVTAAARVIPVAAGGVSESESMWSSLALASEPPAGTTKAAVTSANVSVASLFTAASAGTQFGADGALGPGTAFYAGPTTGVFTPGAFTSMSFDVRFPPAAGAWVLAAPFGDRDTANIVAPGTSGGGSAFNGVSAELSAGSVYGTVTTQAGGVAASKRAGWAAVPGVWYRVELDVAGSGAWTIRVGPPGGALRPMVWGVAPLAGSTQISGVPRFVLLGAVRVRGFRWARFGAPRVGPSVKTVWSATGRRTDMGATVEGGLPTAVPGSLPQVTFRAVAHPPFDRSNLPGQDVVVKATPRFLSVPGG